METNSTPTAEEQLSKLPWYRPTPGRLLIVLLAVEGVLLLSERWLPKHCAVLLAIASVGVTMVLMLLWFVLALCFRWRFQFSIRSLSVATVAVAIPFSWLAVEVKNMRERWKVPVSHLEQIVISENTDRVGDLAFSPDGRMLASANNDHTVKIWDTASGHLLYTLQHSGYVWRVMFAADGRTIISGGADGNVSCWDVASGKLQNTLGGHNGEVTAIALSPDRQLLASCGGYRSGIGKLWDAKTLEPKCDLEKAHFVSSFAFSHDGKVLFGGDSDTVASWEVSTGKRKNEFKADFSSICLVAFLPDGKTLITVGRFYVRMWLVGKPDPRLTIKNEGTNSAVLSQDGRLLATGGEQDPHADVSKGVIRLWDVKAGQQLACITGLRREIHSLAISPDCELLASGDAEGTVKIWNLKKVLKQGNEDMKKYEQPQGSSPPGH
jgi:WD40 repeat protein